jgi:hypothetical protein
MATTETVEADIMRYNDAPSAETLEALPAPVRACVAPSPVSKMTPAQVAAANNHLDCVRALYGVFAVREGRGQTRNFAVLGSASRQRRHDGVSGWGRWHGAAPRC